MFVNPWIPTTFSSHFYSNFSAHVVLGPENRANSRESRASVDSATMENNYGIGVSNKFALFLDEEGEEADVENLLIINAKKVRFPEKIMPRLSTLHALLLIRYTQSE